MSNPKLHQKLIFAGDPLILTFAKCLSRRDANVRIGPPAAKMEGKRRHLLIHGPPKRNMAIQGSCDRDFMGWSARSAGETSLILAPRPGFEPGTIRLTVECSTAELPRNSDTRCSLGGAYNKASEACKARIWQFFRRRRCWRNPVPAVSRITSRACPSKSIHALATNPSATSGSIQFERNIQSRKKGLLRRLALDCGRARWAKRNSNDCWTL
jgi:hypothetical protein